MRRREFITLLGGAAAAWPFAVHAQPTERMRRIGVLMLYAEGDPAGQGRAMAFQQELEQRGWTVGRNLAIDYQWGVGDDEWIRSTVAQMMKLAPDVILANGGSAIRPVQQATRTIPIVFIGGADPVADGFVRSLARPGGNMTGFTVLETSVGAKLLELLKEVAPHVTHVAVMINPDSPSSRRLSDSAVAAVTRFLKYWIYRYLGSLQLFASEKTAGSRSFSQIFLPARRGVRRKSAFRSV
jgi:putative tryptophan/tyrosine transport system substrate-binding protein